MLSVGKASKELGKELKATDLKPRMIVVVKFDGVDYMVSLWVTEVDIMRHTVTFYSGTLGFRSTNNYDKSGSLFDVHGRAIRVFEFLGEK